jgi:hypothetical protein
MTMTVSGADRSIRFDWPAAAAGWAKAVEPTATALMKARAPFFTGKLRQGIGSRTEASAGSTSVTIYGTASYLPFVVSGTGQHVIVPRRVGGVLRWLQNRGHGPAAFATKVQHPGTKANLFPEETMESLMPMLLSRFADACREAVVVE